jgi:hypothetical protein
MKKLLILSFLIEVLTASIGQIHGISIDPAFDILAQYQKVRDLTMT